MAEAKREIEEQELRRKLVRGIAGGVLVAVLLRMVIALDVKLPNLSLGFLTQAAIAFVLSVATHEAGHLAGGGLVGFKPMVIAVWPLRLQRTASSWRITWLRGIGFVVFDPGGASDLPGKVFFMIAAGPFASVVTGMSAAGLSIAAKAHWNPWFNTELNLIAFWSLLTGVLGLVPIPSRYVVNDGTRLLMLVRGEAEAERFYSLVRLSASVLSCSRPREWNRELVDRLPGALDGSPDSISAQTIRYNVLLGSGLIDEADAVLEWLVAQNLAGEVRTIWRLEAAWFHARMRKDLPGARQWMGVASARVKTPEGRCALGKAQAAVAFLEKHWDEAERAARLALKACDRMADTGVTRVVREELEELIQEVSSAKQH